MTLCAAWIRETPDDQELIFATDSCLSGGERWKSGVKLFELPRRDCLICFAGETARTYPLILNLISVLKFDQVLSNPKTDLTEVVGYVCDLFSDLCNSIKPGGSRQFDDVLGDFTFLFGGYSWREGKFLIWTLRYSHEVKAFLSSLDYENLAFVFIGDEVEQARTDLKTELDTNNRLLSGRLDMEPLSVLVKIIRQDQYDYIDGAVQFAKIYRPGTVEFFGMMYPSVAGKKTFLGRDVSDSNNPSVRFIDPDTGTILNEKLPNAISDLSETHFGSHWKFVQDCYPGGTLRAQLSEREKAKLHTILADIAYERYLLTVGQSAETQTDDDV